MDTSFKYHSSNWDVLQDVLFCVCNSWFIIHEICVVLIHEFGCRGIWTPTWKSKFIWPSIFLWYFLNDSSHWVKQSKRGFYPSKIFITSIYWSFWHGFTEMETSQDIAVLLDLICNRWVLLKTGIYSTQWKW